MKPEIIKSKLWVYATDKQAFDLQQALLKANTAKAFILALQSELITLEIERQSLDKYSFKYIQDYEEARNNNAEALAGTLDALKNEKAKLTKALSNVRDIERKIKRG